MIASGVRSSWRRWLRISAVRRCVTARPWCRRRRRVRGTRPDGLPARSGGRAVGRSHACGVCDPSQGEHAAGEEPPSQSEYKQKHQHDGRGRSKFAQEEGIVPGHQATGGVDHTVWYVSQEELKRLPLLAGEPRGREHQAPGEHEETGVAEGEFGGEHSGQGLYPRSPPSGPLSG